MHRTLWLVLLATACIEEKDPIPPEEVESVVIDNGSMADCNGGAIWWPVWETPIVVDALPSVAPPYEITHLGTDLMHATLDGCDAALGLRLTVWVGDDLPDSFPIGGDGRPDLPVMGSAVAKGESDVESTLGYGVYVSSDGALDEPVLIEETGLIWVASDGRRNTPPGGCLVGCNHNYGELYGEQVYAWREGAWERQMSARPSFRVTVRPK